MDYCPAPREIKLEVTHRCRLACIHCSSSAGPSSTLAMGLNDCLGILRQAVQIGVSRVAFSGGEPLLWQGLDQAVRLATAGGMQATIYTSGNVPSFPENIDHLMACGLGACTFSLYGADETAHERMTRIRGSYEATKKAVAYAAGCGARVEVHFVPLSDNYRELEGIARAASDWGVTRVSVLRFVPQGRGRLLGRHALSRLQNLELRRTIGRLREEGLDVRTGSPYNFLGLNKEPECLSGIDRLVIGPDMRIYPCDAFKQVKAEELVGTLQRSMLADGNLLDCWRNSPYLTRIRECLAAPFAEPCVSCNALRRCLSGCLAQKLIQHGDLARRPDPMCLAAKRGV